MPFCPNCQCEYRQGFTRCKDCDVELVASLPQETRNHDDGELELVVLASVPDPVGAQMIQELLERNGIISILQSDVNAGAGAFGGSPNWLLVRKADFPEARELYQHYFEGDKSELRERDENDEDEETR